MNSLRILLTGKTGQVGWELQHTLAALGELIAFDRNQMDLANPDAVRNAIRAASPDIIVNAAAYTAVDRAESEPDLAMQINGIAPGIMAEETRRANALLVHYSTDYVFDGTREEPYTEEDDAHPLSVYGKTKLEGERAIAAAGCAHLILRASWIYSSRGSNFVLTILRLARERKELAVVSDQIGSLTWARALADATAKTLAQAKNDGLKSGVYHLPACGYASRYDCALKIIQTAQEITGDTSGWATLKPIATSQYPLPARRPLNSMMSMEKIRQTFGITMRSWADDLNVFLRSSDCPIRPHYSQGLRTRGARLSAKSGRS